MTCDTFYSTTLPNWFIAFGTVGAVIVSLWLSLRSNKIKYQATGDYFSLLDSSVGNEIGQVIIFKVINSSQLPILIESFHITYNLSGEGKEAMLIGKEFDDIYSTSLPARIEYSEKINLHFKKENLAKILNKKGKVRNINFFFLTNFGKKVKIKRSQKLNWLIHDLIKEKSVKEEVSPQ